ncbi:ATP synthase F1 subunit gamma [Candidatus Gottesmanbacteria bacterium]|nr:ATP synthase F1 subunit gamma [Candidatus Gottesmanbacteria bacterium]
MANIRLIKRRIKSAQNIAQITKAMELVAASKMKKAQAAALSGKLYAQKIYDMVMQLSHKVDLASHPLLRKPEKLSGRTLVIVASSNKGLCGGLNTSLFRFLLTQYVHMNTLSCISVGKKGTTFLVRSAATLVADFSQTASVSEHIPAITKLVIDAFTTGQVDQVDLVYNEFLSVARQNPKRKTILPLSIEPSNSVGIKQPSDMLIEPNVQEVFSQLLPHYMENQIRDALLQSEASEHSARMLAMRNATDNALSLMGDLTLLYNKARQEKITYEITDMVTARLAVKES